MPTLRTPAQLRDRGLIPPESVAALEPVAARYAIAVPETLATLIDHSDSQDPIARQFVPSEAELEIKRDELADPIGDEAYSPIKGIVHRYPDRVLLMLTQTCAVYCRFCFRRETVGKPETLTHAALGKAYDYIRAHDEIWEVILTGGDPLVLSVRRLREVMKALSTIDSVKIVRVHTRIPLAEPAWITAELVRALKVGGKSIYVIVHVNHPRELSPAARTALARMADAGLVLLGQTVLLKGINDAPETMRALMRALVECRVKPYYLHHADLAPGTAHLRTTIETGQSLMRDLRGRNSGLCQPTYVLDIPGGAGKSPIGPNYLTEVGSRDVLVEDFNGGRHRYRQI
jgi:lysine 2,3-aminomutase